MIAVRNPAALSRRYLSVHLKRTLLTILGVLLSVALMCAGGLFGESLKAKTLENVKIQFGSYHARFENLDRERADRLLLNARVGEAGLARQMGMAALSGSRKLAVYGADAAFMNIENIHAVQGRLPEAAGEIAAEAWTLKRDGKSINVGDSVTLALMPWTYKEEPKGPPAIRTFTVCGFLEPQRSSLGTGSGLAITTLADAEQANGSEIGYMGIFTVRRALPIQESITAVAADLGLPGSAAQQNAALLTAMGVGANSVMNQSVQRVQLILALILLIATVAVISNTFTISVVERIRQLGILRCVGATTRQVRGIVASEALIVSAVGIPLGLGCGMLAVFAVIKLFTAISGVNVGFAGLSFVVTWPIVAGAGGLGLVSVILSAVGPALRAGRVPPLEAVVAPGRTVRERIRRRGHAAMRAVFGVVGVMAGRNLARNRRRVVVTVTSIAIGIALFIIFSSFFGMAQNTARSVDPGPFIRDLALYADKLGAGSEFTEEDVQEARNIAGAKKVLAVREENGFLLVPSPAVAGDLREYVRANAGVLDGAPAAGEGEAAVPAAILGLDAGELAELRSRIIEGNPDFSAMEREDGVFIVSSFSTEEATITAVSLSIGDRIRLSGPLAAGGKGAAPVSVKVMGFAASLSWSKLLNGKAVGILASGRTFRRVTGKDTFARVDIELADASVHEAAAESLASIARARAGRVIDYVGTDRDMRDVMVQIAILFYGLVAVISLIGALNIVNTIGTNLLLRVREFGMLRSVGMTGGQLKGMVVLEGILYGLYSAIPGSVLGVLGARLLFGDVENVRKIPWIMPWPAIIGASAAAILLGMLSSLVPLRRMGRLSAVESIRAEE